MRFLRLDLLAHGPFTNVVLDLADGTEGLHVIYGPNEAGKSSALRALRHLLFGIPAQTTDNFIHAYKDLRIGAWLRADDGAELKVVRRKGNAKTLRDPDDEVIDESTLQRCLGGIDQDTFEVMFGIDNAALARGGRAIVDGGGDIGAVLFAAGAGLAHLRSVQQDLEEEAGALFLAKGKKTINQALSELDAARRTLKECQLPSSQWLAHEEALNTASATSAKIIRQLEELRRGVHRLQRIRDALPAIARWKELRAELEPHAAALLLPEDFGSQRRESLFQLSMSENAAAETQAYLDDIDRQIADHVVPCHLLEQAAAIEELHLGLGSQKKALSDRARLATELRQIEVEARSILRELGRDLELDQAGSLRLTAPQRQKIQELGIQSQASTRLGDALMRAEKLGADIEDLQRRLAELPPFRDVGPLVKVISRVQQRGNLTEQWQAARQEFLASERLAAADLQRLPIWSGTLDELARLPVPTVESIERFDTELASHENDRRSLLQEGARLDAESLELDRHLEQLELREQVPTEESLRNARRQRDSDWMQLRLTWDRGDAPPVELRDSYEAEVETSDEIADRLRREADLVAKKAQCLKDCQRCERQREQLARQLEAVESRLQGSRREWQTLWQPAGIDPQPPREMHAWLRKYEALVKQAHDIGEQRERLAGLERRIADSRGELLECLRALGESILGEDSLQDLLDRCQDIVERVNAVEASRRDLQRSAAALEKERVQARSDASSAEEDWRRWQAQWAEAMAQLGLGIDATASQANLVLDRVRDLFDKLDKANSHHRRIEGIDIDSRRFNAEVASLTSRIAPDLGQCQSDQAVIELIARLTRAREAQARLEAMNHQRAAAADKLAVTRAAISDCRARLDVMCREAKCASVEELAEAERRSGQRRELEREIRHAEEQILGLSAGASLVDFLADAEAVDPDALAEQIAQSDRRIEDLDRQRSELDQTIGKEREILGKMDGSAQAAAAHEQMHSLIARIGTDAERFACLRLAGVVLRDAIERYREKNQGPVLKRASELFADLTVGSFEGLRVDFSDQGKPILVGVRSGSRQTVAVHDGMSEGTRDQLYLALRLASLETYLDRHAPVPFIVDDLLIHFDDDRAAAALKALAQLSERTQILFFTHHQHLVDLAKSTLDDDVLFTHELRGLKSAKAV